MTTFAAYSQVHFLHNVNRGSYFYGYLAAAIYQDLRLSIRDGLLRLRCNLYLAVRGKIAFPNFKYLIFRYMPSTMKDYSTVNNSNCSVTPRGAKSAVIYQHIVENRIILPKEPTGLIGEKVVFTDKYKKEYPYFMELVNNRMSTPYITIIDAWTEMRSKGIIVMVKIDVPGTQWKSNGIALSNFKKYE
jgi:hypothetical protein